jgi:uncharacterized protein YybS (DUF2232 family)
MRLGRSCANIFRRKAEIEPEGMGRSILVDQTSKTVSPSTCMNDRPLSSDVLDDDADWIDDEPVASPMAAVTKPQRRVDPHSPIVMVETAFLASAASLIWLVNFYFPIGPILQVFFPIPIALVYMRWGKRACWMSALISALLLTILMGPARSIQYVIPYGLLGVLWGGLWYRRASWGMGVFLGTVVATIGAFFRIWLVSLLLGDDLWRYSTVQVTGLLDWGFDRLNILAEPSLEMVQAIAAALIVLRNVVYAFVVHVVSWFLFDRLGNPMPAPPRWVRTLFEID